MNIFSSLSSYKNTKPSVITIGSFDGLHIGHNVIIEQLITAAKKDNLDSVVLTFFPHPRIILQKKEQLKLITTIEERKKLFDKTGLNNLIIHPFTKDFSELTALEFVRDILVDKLHIKKIIIGYDHRFGKNRNATIKDLIKFGKTYNFEVEEVTAQQSNNVAISSTKIRTALKNGNINLANTYLGHPFTLTGTIVRGKGIGKSLNFPTANLKVAEDYKLIPKNGVYLIESKILDKNIFGLTNIGTNPTVGGTQKTIETYFLDFTDNLYNKQLSLKFITRIRDEKIFKSIDALKLAIKKDEQFARNYMANSL